MLRLRGTPPISQRLALIRTALDNRLELRQVFHSLLEGQERKELRWFAARVLKGLERGQPLSSALRGADPQMPNLVTELVAVGERAGNLRTVFGHLADYYTHMEQHTRLMRQAFVYPAILLVVLWFSLGFFKFYLIGVFAGLYRDLDSVLPPITRFAFALVSLLFHLGWITGLVTVILMLWQPSGLRRVLRRIRGWLSELIAPWRKLVNTAELSRYFFALNVLTQGGVELARSLHLSLGVVESPPLRRKLGKAQLAVERGGNLAPELQKTGLMGFPTLDTLKMGEASGDLGGSFGLLANHFTAKLEELLLFFSSLFQPLLIIVLGLFVGLILVALYIPLFSLGELL